MYIYQSSSLWDGVEVTAFRNGGRWNWQGFESRRRRLSDSMLGFESLARNGQIPPLILHDINALSTS